MYELWWSGTREVLQLQLEAQDRHARRKWTNYIFINIFYFIFVIIDSMEDAIERVYNIMQYFFKNIFHTFFFTPKWFILHFVFVEDYEKGKLNVKI